jgi:hypothetical protein
MLRLVRPTDSASKTVGAAVLAARNLGDLQTRSYRLAARAEAAVDAPRVACPSGQGARRCTEAPAAAVDKMNHPRQRQRGSACGREAFREDIALDAR